MNLFDLFATLSLDSSGYTEGLAEAEAQGEDFGTSLSTGLATAARVGAVAIAATTTAVVAASGAFVNGVASVAEYADHIDKQSQKMNMSAEAFQEWDFIMQHNGTTIDQMQASIKTLSAAVESGSDAFTELGMTQEEVASMSGEELFSATITALQGIEDETTRTYLAGQLLGRGATELGPLLNMTAEETEEMRQQVHELGGVMSDEAVKAGAQFQDSLQNMQTAFSGVKNTLLSEFLPSFSTVMDGLAAIFSGDSSGLELVRQGVNDFAAQMNETMPVFLEIGGEIIGVLGDALVENLPTIISTGADVMNKLVQGLISNLPALISAAVLLITEVTKGLIDAAPQLMSAAIEIIMYLGEYLSEEAPNLIDSAVDVIIQLVEMLTDPDNVETLLGAALDIILAIAEGLIENAPELIGAVVVAVGNIVVALAESLPTIAEKVSTFISELGEDLGNWLYDMFGSGLVDVVDGLASWWDEFVDFSGDVLDNFVDLGADIIETIVDFMGGAGLAFNFDDIMASVGDFGADVIETIFNAFETVKTTVSDAIDALIGFFDFDWSLPDIKLPHFSVSGGEAPWGIGGEGSLPTIGVEWYAKAMSAPMLLTSPTIFGASGGSLLGGGEAGDEMIYGRDALMRDIREATNQQIVIPVYIGGEQIEELVVNSNQRYDFISGGRG